MGSLISRTGSSFPHDDFQGSGAGWMSQRVLLGPRSGYPLCLGIPKVELAMIVLQIHRKRWSVLSV